MMLAVRTPKANSVDIVAVFEARCWARARLFAEGELELHDAVDKLQEDAVRDGLVAAVGQDCVQTMMGDAFGAVRARQPITAPHILWHNHYVTAWDAAEELESDFALLSSEIDRWATTVETLRYLIPLDDPSRLRRWLLAHPRSEIHALEKLLVVV
jgi:hypothetical protein